MVQLKINFPKEGRHFKILRKILYMFHMNMTINNVPKSAVRGGERYVFGRYDEPWPLKLKCLDGVYNVAMAISNNYFPFVSEQQRA